MPHRALAILLTPLLAACSAGGEGGDGFVTDDGGADLAQPARDLSLADLVVPPGADLAVPPGADMATGTGIGPKPNGGNVGATGGTVDRLYFGFHGDTRPKDCTAIGEYPTTIIDSIFSREAQAGVEFSLDLGDHMFVCSGVLSDAQAQMNLYMTASQKLGKTLFMTMGNHECKSSQTYCYLNSTQANYTAYMQALKPISTVPYYSVDIKTDAGLATFVFVADNGWDATEQTWLENTLTKADTAAKYTIVARHHPIDNTDLATLAGEWTIIKAHKYTLFLTGHTHEYKHDSFLDNSGRTIRLGNAGAPLDNNFQWYGYAIVQQGLDDRLYVSVYDQATGNQADAFSVLPQ